jgi:hypothetical protein
VYNQRNGKKELYRLSTDLGESTDLSNQFPEKVNMLSLKLSAQLRQFKAKMPVVKSTGKSLPFPDEH